MSSTSLKTPLSMLDLATVREGRSVADALQTSVQTAQHNMQRVLVLSAIGWPSTIIWAVSPAQQRLC